MDGCLLEEPMSVVIIVGCMKLTSEVPVSMCMCAQLTTLLHVSRDFHILLTNQLVMAHELVLSFPRLFIPQSSRSPELFLTPNSPVVMVR